MKVLVVGGAGYIGSVTAHMLIERGHEVVVLDNLCLGHREAIPQQAQFVEGDAGNARDLARAFEQGVDAVMHFAAFALVGESVEHPSRYYRNNICNGLSLLDAMVERGVRCFVFSSTCAVYGQPQQLPMTEDLPLAPANPYGDSKLAFENILRWYSQAYDFNYASLRYFNAAGATENLGEDHFPESHLIPNVLQVASGKKEHVTIFGDDYDTQDGTCVRDYIHVVDLAEAHLLALTHVLNNGCNVIFNLGSESGFSVKQVIETARKVTGHAIPAKIGARRPGDPARLVASSARIKSQLGWSPRHSDLESIVESAWRWHSKHPQGYGNKRMTHV